MVPGEVCREGDLKFLQPRHHAGVLPFSHSGDVFPILLVNNSLHTCSSCIFRGISPSVEVPLESVGRRRRCIGLQGARFPVKGVIRPICDSDRVQREGIPNETCKHARVVTAVDFADWECYVCTTDRSATDCLMSRAIIVLRPDTFSPLGGASEPFQGIK